MTPSSRAVATAVLAAAIAFAASLGLWALVIVAVALAGLVAWAWAPLLQVPAPGGTTVVVAAAGLLAILAGWQTDGGPLLRFVPLVIAMALVLAFLAEMLRRDGRARLVESVSATATGALVAAALAGWVAIARETLALVVCGALAIALSAIIWGILPADPAVEAGLGGWRSRLGRWIGPLGALVATGLGGVTGWVCATLLTDLTVASGVAVGVAAAATVYLIQALLASLPTALGNRRGFAAATVPMAVAGITVYAAAWLAQAL